MNDIKAQLRPTSTRPLPVECGCRPILLTLVVVMPWTRRSNAWSRLASFAASTAACTVILPQKRCIQK